MNKPPVNKESLEAFIAKNANKSKEDQKPLNPNDLDAMGEEAFELSEEEKAELRAEAKQKVFLERKAAMKKEYLQAEIKRHRSLGKPGEEIVSCTIDLPGHADRIVMDGVHYFHGATYKVSRSKFDSIRDICARAWEHEHEVGGANRDVYRGRTPVNATIRPGDEGKIGPIVRF